MSRPADDISTLDLVYMGVVMAIVLVWLALGDLWRKVRGWLPLLLLTACASNPLAVESQRRATPDEVVRNVGWYREVARCAERPDASGRVRWWYVDKIELEGARSPYGVTRGDDILIVPSNPPPGQPMKGVVHRHESLHHLLWVTSGDADGNHDHPLWDQCINQGRR